MASDASWCSCLARSNTRSGNHSNDQIPSRLHVSDTVAQGSTGEKEHVPSLRNVNRHDEGNELLNSRVDGTPFPYSVLSSEHPLTRLCSLNPSTRLSRQSLSTADTMEQKLSSVRTSVVLLTHHISMPPLITNYRLISNDHNHTSLTHLLQVSMSLAPLATSVPWMPMATPMSAWFSAGASFTPSPVLRALALRRRNSSPCPGKQAGTRFHSRPELT